MWLWDAGSHLGVAGSKQDAVDAAGEYIGDAGAARVERAWLGYDEDLLHVHKRTGVGVAGTLRDGRVCWEPLERAAA